MTEPPVLSLYQKRKIRVMIVRATRKLLKTYSIRPLKDDAPLPDHPPGEWYANGVTHARKSIVHYFHAPTKVSVIVPGRSLLKTTALVPGRLASLLDRQGYADLLALFAISIPATILTTNSRKMLAHMNQLRMLIEYYLALPEQGEEVDYDQVEDVCFDDLFTKGGKTGHYERPAEILKQWRSE